MRGRYPKPPGTRQRRNRAAGPRTLSTDGPTIKVPSLPQREDGWSDMTTAFWLDLWASPMAGGLRELTEETGYTSPELVELGVVHPNPALQGNRCFTFLAKDAYLAGPPRLDETEDIEVVCYRREEVPRLLREGRISHALVVVCFFWLFQYERLYE